MCSTLLYKNSFPFLLFPFLTSSHCTVFGNCLHFNSLGQIHFWSALCSWLLTLLSSLSPLLILLNIYNFAHYIHRTEGHCNTLLLHNGRNLLWIQACCVKSNMYCISANSFRRKYSFLRLKYVHRYIHIVSAITLLLCSKCCRHYLRAETIQGQKLFVEIRYLFPLSSIL